MVKAKQLKLLRKQLEKCEKTPAEDVLPSTSYGGGDGGDGLVGVTNIGQHDDVSSWLSSHSTTAGAATTSKDDDKDINSKDSVVKEKENATNGSDSDLDDDLTTPLSKTAVSTSPTTKTTVLHLHSWSSTDLQKHSYLDQVVDLFESNMGDFYKASSWGLDLEKKRQELCHPKARFLVLLASTSSSSSSTSSSSTTQHRSTQQIAGFCHYRLEYDDDESPTAVVVYVYELQIASTYRRQGLGRKLMTVVETLANGWQLSKVMLTVFKRNKPAMDFYCTKLHYNVDGTSPSQHGVTGEDYEILSKTVTT